MQISWQPEPNWLINTSSFIGRVPTENEPSTRIYSNLFTTLQLNPRMWMMGGWDWGIQGNQSLQWNDLLFQYRYAVIQNRFFGNLRYEYLSDPQSVFKLSSAGLKNQIHLASFNVDYIPVRQCMLRAEVGYQFSPNKIFNMGDLYEDRMLSFLLIASVQLDYIK
jgi:hypothetical protein